MIDKVLKNDSELYNAKSQYYNIINHVYANEGDIYCFEGNLTLHAAGKSYGNKDR